MSQIRICPGRHLADVNLWLAMATILSLFNIKKIKGKDGQEIKPEVGMDSGLTRFEGPVFFLWYEVMTSLVAIQNHTDVLLS